MIELKKLENVSTIAIVVAFFLPWVNLGFISFSGHDLPNLWDAVNSLSNAFSETENVSAGGKLLFSGLSSSHFSIGVSCF